MKKFQQTEQQVISAPGKLILIGEYAVLETSPAVVMAVDRRVILADVQPGKVAQQNYDRDLVAFVRRESADKFGLPLQLGNYQADSSAFYSGDKKLGLGSSAAVVACSTASVFHEGGLNIFNVAIRQKIWQLAYYIHNKFQGITGSGIDLAASIFGGTIVMDPRIDDIAYRFTNWTLPEDLQIIFLWTTKPASTPAMLETVKTFKNNFFKSYNSIISSMESTAKQMIEAGPKDSETVLYAFRRYAALMEELGLCSGAPIVTEAMKPIFEAANAAGGAAKPSGAGGGDFLIALFPKDKNISEFIKIANAQGMEIQELKPTQKGVSADIFKAIEGPQNKVGTVESKHSSRLPGWHLKSRTERIKDLATVLKISPETLHTTLDTGGLDMETAELLTENVVGLYSLPFSVATNFLINGKNVLVPMVIEEPSVVAAASNGARMIRKGGGFSTFSTDPNMICQIQIFTETPHVAREKIIEEEKALLALAALVDKKLVDLGGGPTELEVRVFSEENPGENFVVVHLIVNVLDAMGANTVNTMGEALAPELEKITGGRVALRILSNLSDLRIVVLDAAVPLSMLEMKNYPAEVVRDGIISASRFAELDPYRAATHNKGIMNGTDAVLMATGNDWRAVEAGAHAYAAKSGNYSPLCTWKLGENGSLRGHLEMPMAVGIVGGATKVHPCAQLALKIMGATSQAINLANVAAAAGMANNLTALRALATEGIQRGHMRLHNRSR